MFERTEERLKVTAVTWGAALALSAFAGPALAGEYVTARHIVRVGCHQTNGTCYVELDGAAFGGSEGCTQGATNEFRWDNADTANGRRTYASFLAAYLAQKSVEVSISGCSGQGVPSLVYYSIRN